MPNTTEKYYIGTLCPSIPKFKVTKATLTYNDENDLSGDVRILMGHIAGTSLLKLSLERSVTIAGKLDQPLPGNEYTVNGSGSWSSTFDDKASTPVMAGWNEEGWNEEA
ncbi:hypothetical protein AX17_005405 [Amanita inopinata Kibby_2008]|nr:hypothetical protein AX17_005405 [Amanita inopinata Kibby_2008]